jgi:hypothetical protein
LARRAWPRIQSKAFWWPAAVAGNSSVPSTRGDEVDHGGDMHLSMGINTTGDGLFGVCDPGHVVLFA